MPNKKLSSRHQVERFLNDFQKIFKHDPCIYSKNPKNDATMIKLGITNAQRDQVLRELKPENYYAGPKKDQLHRGSYWEFGKEINQVMIYIKIKIHTTKDGTDILYCYSFHESEDPMNYFPFA